MGRRVSVRAGAATSMGQVPSAAAGGVSKSARRLVAQGRSTPSAVAQTSGGEVGPRQMYEELQELNAARLGMTPPLLALLEQEGVTDVLINGRAVWVDRGKGLESEDLGLRGDEVRALAVRLAAAGGKRLDDASPMVDAILDARFRLHAVLPPIARGEPAISLRAVRSKPFALADLAGAGAMTAAIEAALRQAVAKRRSILVCGATGAGKTTLLASLLGLVGPEERIVCIEEVSELSVNHPHFVQLQARDANIEGEGGVGLDHLVRAAVRMRPDRIVLGECRGAEVREVLTAMNTGHQGSCATIHSNSIEDVPARLIALGSLGALDAHAVRALAASAFDVLVHMQRSSAGKRFVSALGELRRGDDGLEAVVTLRGCGGP